MSRLLPLALAASCASAAVLPRAAAPKASPGFLSYPIVERRTIAGSKQLGRRDDTATLFNATNVAYLIEIDIGTPAQTVRVQIDTGSNELWVDPDCSNVSSASGQALCQSGGSYVVSDSSTATDLKLTTSLAYGIGSVELEYVTDTISIPGTDNNALTDVQFGVATASEDATLAIMGVGFGYGFNLDYYNIIDEIVNQGLAATRAFSVILGTDVIGDDVGENIANGALIFGGVDTMKFSGPLYNFTNLQPQASDGGQLWRYWLQLDSIGFTKAGSKTSETYAGSTMNVILDSGSSLSYLPQSVISDLAGSFGVADTSSSSQGLVQVDCDAGDNGGSVDFTFGSLTINVPLSDFIWQADTDLCIIGASATSDESYLLGDTFMRSAYTLFDQDNLQIYLAKAANCGTNEQALPNATSFSFTGECTEDAASAAPAAALPFSISALAGLVVLQAFMHLM